MAPLKGKNVNKNVKEASERLERLKNKKRLERLSNDKKLKDILKNEFNKALKEKNPKLLKALLDRIFELNLNSKLLKSLEKIFYSHISKLIKVSSKKVDLLNKKLFKLLDQLLVDKKIDSKNMSKILSSFFKDINMVTNEKETILLITKYIFKIKQKFEK